LRTHLTAGLPFSRRAWPTYLIILIVANSSTARKSRTVDARRLALSSPIQTRQASSCNGPSLYHRSRGSQVRLSPSILPAQCGTSRHPRMTACFCHAHKTWPTPSTPTHHKQRLTIGNDPSGGLGLGKAFSKRSGTAVNDPSAIPLNGISRGRIPPPPLRVSLAAAASPVRLSSCAACPARRHNARKEPGQRGRARPKRLKSSFATHGE
jgi:hypothetical protein